MAGKGITWPLVALALVAVAGVVGMFALSSGQDRSALIAVLSAVASAVVAAYLGRRVNAIGDKVDRVEVQTNGHAPCAACGKPLVEHRLDNVADHPYRTSLPVTFHSGQASVPGGQSTVERQWIPYNERDPSQRRDDR